MFLWISAAILAYFIKGLCGFANTLVFTTLLSFGHSNISISPVELLLGYPSNLILAIQERRHIRWRICLPLILLVLTGSIPGALRSLRDRGPAGRLCEPCNQGQSFLPGQSLHGIFC